MSETNSAHSPFAYLSYSLRAPILTFVFWVILIFTFVPCNGPTIANGYLIEEDFLGWRWVFTINNFITGTTPVSVGDVNRINLAMIAVELLFLSSLIIAWLGLVIVNRQRYNNPTMIDIHLSPEWYMKRLDEEVQRKAA